MITSTKIHFLLCFIAFFSFSTIAQNTITITLYVDTDKITKDNLNQYDVINFGQDRNIPNEEYEVFIDSAIAANTTIVWVGQAMNGTDEVNIVTFKHEDFQDRTRVSKKLFDKKKFRDRWFKRSKTGGIQNKLIQGLKAGDSEKYTIKFHINKDPKNKPRGFLGVYRPKYKIDPRLTIRIKPKYLPGANNNGKGTE